MGATFRDQLLPGGEFGDSEDGFGSGSAWSSAVAAMVVCGREDQVTPLSLSHELASLLKDAELVAVEEAGHMSILEQPAKVVAALVRWLRRVDATTARLGERRALT